MSQTIAGKFSEGGHQPLHARLMQALQIELQLEIDKISSSLVQLRIWLVSV